MVTVHFGSDYNIILNKENTQKMHNFNRFITILKDENEINGLDWQQTVFRDNKCIQSVKQYDEVE